MLEWRIEEGLDLDNFMNGDFQEFWSRDQFSSPFCSPAFLRELVGIARGKGCLPFAVRGMNQQSRTVVIWPLCIDKGGVLRFLQDEGYDHCMSLHLPEATIEDISLGLVAAIKHVRPSSIFLTCIPPWSSTLQAAKLGLAGAGWKQKAFPAWACPVLGVESGVRAKEQLQAKVKAKGRLKSYENKLKRESGYAFEVFEDIGNLEVWAHEFCDCHEERWKNTSTPSIYESSKERERFLGTLRAWHYDGVLIRYSIRLSIGRVAFVVGLRAGERMIYHHVAQNPQYQSMRAGHILIRRIVLWMSEHGFSTLDFGTGNEEYKYRWANSDEKVWRIYGARSFFSIFYLKALLDQKLRSSEKLQEFWDEWVNRRIRGDLMRWVSSKEKFLSGYRTESGK